MSVVALAGRDVRPAAPGARVQRVCLVTEASGGGVGRHFLDLAAALAQRGIDVTAIYSPLRCDDAFGRRLNQIRGVRFIRLPMRRAIQPADIASIVRLVQCLRHEGPLDIIHGHSSKGGAIARLAAHWLGIPAVYTPHAFVTLDPTLSPAKRWLYGLAERSLARHSAALIAVSEDEARHAISLGIEARKLHVVHNGIDAPALGSRGDARRRLGCDPQDVIIGFVGRLVPQKAPDLLVRAFSRVASQCPHVRLALIGSGPLQSKIQAEVERLGVVQRVRLVGEAEAADYLSAFDVFCLPSRYEGLPYVLLEALAAGLPIVATRVGGAAACVTPEENGLLVETGDERGLAAALAQLAEDASLRGRFGAAARRRASEFSLKRMIDGTLGIYESAVAVPHSHRF